MTKKKNYKKKSHNVSLDIESLTLLNSLLGIFVKTWIYIIQCKIDVMNLVEIMRQLFTPPEKRKQEEKKQKRNTHLNASYTPDKTDT